MENTGGTLFEDDSSRWYVGIGEKYLGPLTASEVYEKLVSQEISWAHFVWREGQAEWARLCDTPEFKTAVPSKPKAKPPTQAPAKPVIKQATPRAPEPPVVRNWFSYQNNTQAGPFSEDEVRGAIQSGKILTSAYLWCEGMKGWEKIEKVDLFRKVVPAPSAPAASSKAVSDSGKKAPERSERRTLPRRPLIAKMILATTELNQETVIVGVCRDISIGGMQVLTDRVPGQVGAKIKMNVSPSGGLESDTKIEPFVATGVIVRTLEDGRGFSFRFDQLGTAARKSIEDYFQS